MINHLTHRSSNKNGNNNSENSDVADKIRLSFDVLSIWANMDNRAMQSYQLIRTWRNSIEMVHESHTRKTKRKQKNKKASNNVTRREKTNGDGFVSLISREKPRTKHQSRRTNREQLRAKNKIIETTHDSVGAHVLLRYHTAHDIQ